MDQTSGSSVLQEWSVHAQLVLSHGDAQRMMTGRTTDGDAVQMQYSWEPGVNSIWETSATRPAKPSYGFQRGNLVFTTSPPQCGINRVSEIRSYGQTFPRRSAESKTRNLSRSPVTLSDTTDSSFSHTVGPLLDSGYASDKFNTFPARRTVQPYGRRCRSTCSIVLSCEFPYDNVVSSAASHPICSACGGSSSDISAGVCDKCQGSKPASRAHVFSTQFSTHVLADEQEKSIKDASSQTHPETDPDDARKDLLKPDVTLPVPSPDLLKPKNEKGKLRRSPARLRGRSPYLNPSVEKKQPRTVHIDVYCTGSDEADDSDISSSEEDAAPRTIYESDDTRVTHRRARRNELPTRKRIQSYYANESDEQNPSAESSRTTFADSSGTIPTASSAALSQSSSWKDTETSSIPRSGVSLLDTSSASNSLCMTSDSFEYADSIDKHRIRALEEKLSGRTDSDRNVSVREKIFNKYLESKSFPIWKESSRENVDSDSSSDSSGSEVLWTFTHFPQEERGKPARLKESAKSIDSGSLSDSAQTTVCRMEEDARSTSSKKSFTGRADFVEKAQKFGEIISNSRKPGHHVGPAKNPDCSCRSCLFYYQDSQCRGRTRSVGESFVHRGRFFNRDRSAQPGFPSLAEDKVST